jgi:hypothetical protein
MSQPQLKMWSAEPHPTPPVYQQLTPEERSRLVHQLAQLILKLVQHSAPPSSPQKNHER